MPSTTRFADTVVFITGAGSGIGRATALAFAREGARVAVADLAGDGLDQTVALVRDTGADVLSLHVDVTDAATVEAAVTTTVDTFGRLDVAFNNAGIEQSQTPPRTSASLTSTRSSAPTCGACSSG
jgi:NAD(P)-dependent dehydrogenase (short-subunit alcohol dehydrogenase family)